MDKYLRLSICISSVPYMRNLNKYVSYGDNYEYMYKLSTAYEEIYISMCPTGDKYKYVSYGR